ncbi:MAG TPA: hypothetical protein VM262_04075 [Acidimicrobiales bacterium]|nr:hypothetical protein [Acidimicrobiales bacterium]
MEDGPHGDQAAHVGHESAGPFGGDVGAQVAQRGRQRVGEVVRRVRREVQGGQEEPIDVTEWRQVGTSAIAVPARVRRTTGDGSDLPYYVDITVENVSGVAECTELTVTRKPGGAPISAEGVRRLPIARLTEWATSAGVARLKDPERGIAGGLAPELVDPELPVAERQAEVLRVADAVSADRSAGRRRITDDDLNRLADICRQADLTGMSYIALAALEMGLTPDQARQWKRKAIAAGIYQRP